jgi:hypothetical protein
VSSNFDRARDTPSVDLSVDMIRLLVSRSARLDVRWNGLTLAELAKAHFAKPIELRQLTLDKVDSTGVIPRVQGEFDASTPSDAERQKFYEVKRRKVLQLLDPGKAAPHRRANLGRYTHERPCRRTYAVTLDIASIARRWTRDARIHIPLNARAMALFRIGWRRAVGAGRRGDPLRPPTGSRR